MFVRGLRGTGDVKIGGNYGPTILAQVEAQKQGAQQALWLFGPDQEVTEVGTMNLFVFWIKRKGSWSPRHWMAQFFPVSRVHQCSNLRKNGESFK